MASSSARVPPRQAGSVGRRSKRSTIRREASSASSIILALDSCISFSGASSIDDVMPVTFLPCQLKPLLVAMSRTEFSMRWMRLTEAVFYGFEYSPVKHPP